jgi:hypothetical protein
MNLVEGENSDVNATNEQQLRKMDVVISGFVPNQTRLEEMTNSASSQLSDLTC